MSAPTGDEGLGEEAEEEELDRRAEEAREEEDTVSFEEYRRERDE